MTLVNSNSVQETKKTVERVLAERALEQQREHEELARRLKEEQG